MCAFAQWGVRFRTFFLDCAKTNTPNIFHFPLKIITLQLWHAFCNRGSRRKHEKKNENIRIFNHSHGHIPLADVGFHGRLLRGHGIGFRGRHPQHRPLHRHSDGTGAVALGTKRTPQLPLQPLELPQLPGQLSALGQSHIHA